MTAENAGIEKLEKTPLSYDEALAKIYQAEKLLDNHAPDGGLTTDWWDDELSLADGGRFIATTKNILLQKSNLIVMKKFSNG